MYSLQLYQGVRKWRTRNKQNVGKCSSYEFLPILPASEHLTSAGDIALPSRCGRLLFEFAFCHAQWERNASLATTRRSKAARRTVAPPMQVRALLLLSRQRTGLPWLTRTYLWQHNAARHACTTPKFSLLASSSHPRNSLNTIVASRCECCTGKFGKACLRMATSQQYRASATPISG